MSQMNPLDLARIKLTELRRQRERLTAHYQTLESAAADPEIPMMDRLRRLAEGLQSAKFAQTPLHPAVGHMGVHLTVLEAEAEFGAPSTAMIRRWTERLQLELGQGRTRVEFAWLFGQLLEEHLAAPAPSDPPDPTAADWAGLWTAWEGTPDRALLQEIVDRRPKPFAQLGALIDGFEEQALAPATNKEVRALLEMVRDDPDRAPAARQGAAAALASANYVGEYSDVLTILLDRFDEWTWPEPGRPIRGSWQHGRCRPHVDSALLHQLLVELLALRWGIFLKGALQKLYAGPDGLFPRPEPGSPPERSLSDAWRSYAAARRAWRLDRDRVSAVQALLMHRMPASVAEAPKSVYPGKKSGKARGGGPPAPAGVEQQLIVLQGQLELHRALSPVQPLHVLYVDLADFFPSLPHTTILEVARTLGFGPRWLQFFERLLQIPVQTADGEQRVVRRGMPQDRLFNWLFSELTLLLLDTQLYSEVDLRTIRVGDDVYLVSPDAGRIVNAWRLITAFCEGTGLAASELKSGFVTLEGDAPPPAQNTLFAGLDAAALGLPQRLPRWGYLALWPDGRWRIDEEQVQTFERWLVDALESAPSILWMVSRYNRELGFLLHKLGLAADLGTEHLDAVGRRLTQLHQHLFGPGQGVEGAILRRARERLGGPVFGGEPVPSPLLYWPLTAGGLGLRHPLITVVALRQSRYGQIRGRPPAYPAQFLGQEAMNRVAWKRACDVWARNWVTFAQSMRRTPRPTPPAQTPELKAMMQDFIQRGSELGGRTQSGLGVYWQWVVYTYGPPLLDAVGTFRFLLTELVPLPLILESRGAVAGGSDEPPPPEDPGYSGDNIPF